MPVTGTFSSINWAGGPYYLKTETDPTGGTSYTVVGTTQLLSVPYALYSGATESIPNNSVTSAKIADGTILTADLANASITSAKIADGNVGNADLSDGSVTSSKIVDGTISSSDLADGSVTAAKILDGTIAAADIANSAITPVKINSTGAVADNVLQYTGSAVSWGYAPGAEIKYTVLDVTCNIAVPLTTTYVKVADIGSFTKLVAGSRLEVTFFGRVQVATFTSSTGAIFEIRIDNTATTIGRARAVLREAFAGYGGVNVSMSGIFEGFGTGTHSVSVWARTFYGTGTEARIDPGCWQTDHVIIREIM